MKRSDDANPIICGRRNCAACGRWRHAVDFKWRWNKKRVPNVNQNARTKTRSTRKRHPTPIIDSVCKACRRRQSKERYHSLTPAQKHKIIKRANANAAKLRAKWEQEIHYARMSVDNNHDIPDDENLDVVPFRMWLLGQIRIQGSASIVARMIGVQESRIRHLADGYYWPSDNYCDEPAPIRTVRVSTVDIYGLKMGDPGLLNRLYPYVGPLEPE